MELVIELLGRPSESDLQSMQISYDSNVIEALSWKKKISFSETFEKYDPSAVELIRKLLIYKPEKRLSVEDVLNHSFFSQFHNEINEIKCDKKIILPIDDSNKLSLKEYRDAIYECISEKIKEHKIKAPKENRIFEGN